jgi:hypothetical protein
MRQMFVAIALTLFALPALRADVTLRYKMELKLNPGMPDQLAEQTKKSLDNTMSPETTLQFRNGKGFSSGAYASIIDFTKQMDTLLDTKGKRYATVSSGQFADEMVRAMPQQPAEAKAAIGAMKGHFQSKPVTYTGTIQGVEAEEHEFEMSIDAPPMLNTPEGPMIRMVMRMWMAKSSEAMRVPAIREVAGYNLFAIATMNPAQTMEKILSQVPGMGEAIMPMMKELQSGTGVLLRMQFEMYMPMAGVIMKQHPESMPLGAGFDPDSPVAQVNKELVEISTAAIPDSVFQVPEGFQSATVADMLKDLFAAAQATGRP